MPHLIDFLDDLVRVLYKKEYFGFIETAENESYFFLHDKAEVIKQKKEGKIKILFFYVNS